MSRKWKAIVAGLLSSSLFVPGLHAADGPYLGAGLGIAAIKDEVDTGGSFDSDDASYRAFVGWRFDVMPGIDLAVELAYTDFGRPSQNVSAQNVQYKLTGPSLAGLLIVPLGPVDLYGKAGVIDWNLDRTLGAATTNNSGTDAFYGAGIGVYVWKIGFRAEYERFQIKDVDRVEMLSVSVLFQF
jgi:opacity protein-like surface antigen